MGQAGKHLAVLREVGVTRHVGMSSPGDREGRLYRIEAYILRLPSWATLLLGAALVVVVGWLDYLTGPDLSFIPFYLAPVAAATWLLGRWAGVAVALASTLAWSLAYVYNQPAIDWGTLVPYWNMASCLGIFLVVSLILSGLRSALNQEKELARTDPITGAPNSRAFFEHVEQELVRSLRYGHPFSVAYLDADDFKAINDRFGHTAGDTLLRVVAETVQGTLRSADLVARIAGDEFTLLLPQTGSKEAAMAMSRISEALAATMQQNGWTVTFSMGVVTYLTPPPTVDAIIKAADDAMYLAKRSGKNSIKHAVYGERAGAA